MQERMVGQAEHSLTLQMERGPVVDEKMRSPVGIHARRRQCAPMFRRSTPWSRLTQARGGQSEVGLSEPERVDYALKSGCAANDSDQAPDVLVRLPYTDFDPQPWRPGFLPWSAETELSSSRPVDPEAIHRQLLRLELERYPSLFNLNRIVEESCACIESIFAGRIVLHRELKSMPMYFGPAALLRDALLSLLQWVAPDDTHKAEHGPPVVRVATWPMPQRVCGSIGLCPANPLTGIDPGAAKVVAEVDQDAEENGFLHNAREIIVNICQGQLELVRLPVRVEFQLPLLHPPVDARER